MKQQFDYDSIKSFIDSCNLLSHTCNQHEKNNISNLAENNLSEINLL